MTDPIVSQEAEQALLGSILLSPAVMDEISLGPGDFYGPANSIIYREIQALYRDQSAIDLVTVTERLIKAGKLDEVGGPLYVAGLSEAVGVALNAPHYAKIVKEKAVLRRLAQIAQEISHRVGEVDDVTAFLDDIEGKVFSLRSDQDERAVYSMSEIVTAEAERIQALFSRDKDVVGLKSGFSHLDYYTGGWQKGDLIILAARPSMGKTALALNIAFNAAFKEKAPVVFFSLEQPKEQLAQRQIAGTSRINASRIRTARMTSDEWALFMGACGEILDADRLFIIDKPSLTTGEIRAHSRRIKARHGLGLVVVDYLQLIRGSQPKSREQEVGGISRALKELAKELGVPVIALSQLNRKVEERPNKRPMLSDLRESGSIEQDADLVIFIYRDEVYNENSQDAGKAEVKLAKHRNGPTGKVTLAYHREYMKFDDYEDERP